MEQQQGVINSKSSYIAKDYQIFARHRKYDCPICGTGKMVGYVCPTKTHHLRIGRYAVPELTSQVELSMMDGAINDRNYSRFHLFICNRCYYMADAPVALRDRKVEVDQKIFDFTRRHNGCLSKKEGGLTLGQLFWHCLRRQKDFLGGKNWFDLAQEAELLNLKTRLAFKGKEASFNQLMTTLFNEQYLNVTINLVRKMQSVLDKRLVDLVLWKSYQDNSILFGLYLFRMLEYSVIIGRQNEHLFVVDQEGDPVESVIRFLTELNDGRPAASGASGQLMMTAAKMIDFAGSNEEVLQAKQIMLLASELSIRSGNLDYNDPDIHPDCSGENNEMIRYVNLVLRKELDVADADLVHNRALLERELDVGLRQCANYGRGEGSFNQRRTCRMGEQVSRLVRDAIEEGSIDSKRFISL